MRQRPRMLTFYCIYLVLMGIGHVWVRLFAWNFSNSFRKAVGLQCFCCMCHGESSYKKLLASAHGIKSSCNSSINWAALADLGNAHQDFQDLHPFPSSLLETPWASSWVIILLGLGQKEWELVTEASWRGVFMVQFDQIRIRKHRRKQKNWIIAMPRRMKTHSTFLTLWPCDSMLPWFFSVLPKPLLGHSSWFSGYFECGHAWVLIPTPHPLLPWRSTSHTKRWLAYKNFIPLRIRRLK